MLTESGGPVQAPAKEAAIFKTAACCALCNDSTLTYNNGVLPCCCSALPSCLHSVQSCRCHVAFVQT